MKRRRPITVKHLDPHGRVIREVEGLRLDPRPKLPPSDPIEGVSPLWPAPGSIGTKFGRAGLQFRASTSAGSIYHAIRELARASWRNGLDVTVSPYDPDPSPSWARTSIRHLIGQVRPPMAVVRWGRQDSDVPSDFPTVEFDVADSFSWGRDGEVEKINGQTALLCVPTESNVAEFRDAGVTVPIEVVPLGIDPHVFRPWPKDRALFDLADWGAAAPPGRGVFVFLAAAYFQHRKNLPLVIEAFRRLFRPDDPVALLIKSVPEEWGKSVQRDVETMRGDARIGILEAELSPYEMARLYSTADAFVNAHAREGFGLMPLEAMACGTPAVVTAYDGPLAYADDSTAVLIEPDTIGAPPAHLDVPPNASWAHLSTDGIADALLEAYSGGARARRRAALERAGEFVWANCARKLADAVRMRVCPIRKRPPRGTSRSIPLDRGLTVLIPARDPDPSELDRCLRSLRRTAFDVRLDVILFDDGSKVPFADAVEPYRVRVIRSETPIGEGAARSILLEEAETPWVFCTDADTEFPFTDWADEALSIARSRRARRGDDGGRTVVHPLILRPDRTVWSAGGQLTRYGDDYLPAGHRHPLEAEDAVTEARRLVYAPFVGWFARRSLLLDLWEWPGGYFPTLFADVDAAYWLRSEGVTFGLALRSRIVHHSGTFTQRRTDGAEQSGRFQRNAREFLYWWGDRLEHDIACRLFPSDLKESTP